VWLCDHPAGGLIVKMAPQSKMRRSRGHGALRASNVDAVGAASAAPRIPSKAQRRRRWKRYCPASDAGQLPIHRGEPGAAQGFQAAGVQGRHLQSSSGAQGFKASGPADASGEIHLQSINVYFLDGEQIKIPVRPGASVLDVKMEACIRRSVPPGMLLQLVQTSSCVQSSRALDNSEDVTQYVGSSLTAVFTRLPISDEARALLLCCSKRTPEEGRIELLDISFPAHEEDMPQLAELLQHVQPRRLCLGSREVQCLSRLADHVINSRLDLEALTVRAASVEELAHITRLVRRCPHLQTCDLAMYEGLTKDSVLSAADVEGLRSETNASVLI